MRPQIVTIFAFTLLILSSGAMLGQSAAKGDKSPPPPDQRTPPDLFLDERLIWLLLAGLVYGAYVAYKRGRFKEILR